MWMIIGSLGILIIYIVSILIIGKKIPESISQSYYLLNKGGQLIFTLTIWGIALLTIPESIKYSNWALLCGLTGILLVGAAPRVNDKFERIIHIIGAVLSCMGSQIWIILSGNYLTLLTWILPLIAYGFKTKNIVFWIELACILSYYINLFIII